MYVILIVFSYNHKPFLKTKGKIKSLHYLQFIYSKCCIHPSPFNSLTGLLPVYTLSYLCLWFDVEVSVKKIFFSIYDHYTFYAQFD